MLGALLVVDILADIVERSVLLFFIENGILVKTETLAMLNALAVDILGLVCLGGGLVVEVKVSPRVLAGLMDYGALDWGSFGLL